MENNSSISKMFIFSVKVFLIFAILVNLCGPKIGLFLIFILMSSYTKNFVLKPISKAIGIMNSLPYNYMFIKLQNIRFVIWIFSIILELPLIFFIEFMAMLMSIIKIDEMRREMGMEITAFSKDDYLTYEKYSEFLVESEYNKQEEEFESDYTEIKKVYSDEKNKNNEVKIKFSNAAENKMEKEFEIIKEEVYETIAKEPIFEEIDKIEFEESNKFDFDKSVEEIANVEPIKTSVSSIWDKPVGSESDILQKITLEQKETFEDEICCEKCGEKMSKMKIACPKCGTLVKNTYRSKK